MYRLLIFAPTRRAHTETFVRANLSRLPFQIQAYFGDELVPSDPWQFCYGVCILISKILTRLHLLRAATVLPSMAALALVKRHQPDVVLVEFGFHAVRVMEAAAWCNVPMVVHFRGADASADVYLKTLRCRYRRLLHLSAAVIVKSRQMRAVLVRLGADPSRILISPSGADEHMFHGSSPAAAEARFVAVGRFVHKKGPLETVEAFALMREALLDSGVTASLVMVGEGPLLGDVRQRLQELCLADSVDLPGSLEPRSIAELLRTARAFVQHSRVAPDGDSEGSPVSVMEAQLSGLPVVATRHAGIPDVVIEGSTGFLVDEGDVSGMAEAMTRLAMDRELAGKMGEAAHLRAAGTFTIEHHIRQVSERLTSLCSQHDIASGRHV